MTWRQVLLAAVVVAFLILLGMFLAYELGGTKNGDSSSCRARHGICPTTTVPTTTTSPTTTTTTPTGGVVFGDGFETGNLNLWEQRQCLNYGYLSNAEFTRGNVYAVSDIKAKGAYSARFDLPPSTNKSACEISKGPFAGNGIGTDTWYSLETFFPTNWQEPSPAGWGLALAQVHFQWPQIWAGPLSLDAHANYARLALQSGRCEFGTGCSTNIGWPGDTRNRIIPTGQLFPGQWHQFIIHGRWATDNSGIIEAWFRHRGETTWAKTVTVTGVPTLQTDLNGVVKSYESYDKIGAYRGNSGFALSVWHDNFCHATSFAAAESCF